MVKFAEAKTTRVGYNEIIEAFERNGLTRLRTFCLALLDTCLSCSSEEGTHQSSLVRGSSFLMYIMRVAGYGRALKSSAAAKSAEARNSDYNYMDQEIEQIILKIHDVAI